MSTQTVRTTLALPADLLAAVDQAVQAGHARSRNEFVARALQRELAAQQRAAIDAAFAAMAEVLPIELRPRPSPMPLPRPIGTQCGWLTA